MLSLVVCLAFSFQAVEALAIESQSATTENPIRRIVTLLQKMQSEVQADGKRDEEMNTKFACYCQTNEGGLGTSVSAAGEAIPQIEADIESAESLKSQLDQELVEHKQVREDAKGTIATATAQREKEAASFAEESTELKTNIQACGSALEALRKGMSGSFLQSEAVGTLRQLAVNRPMDRYSQSVLTEFLSTSSQYAPVSGEVTGIISQLKEDMEKELADATAAENTGISQFEGLVAAKKKEIQAATDAIESKTERAGATAVQIVSLKNDLSDTQDSLASDEKFLADLKKDCATKATEFDERKALRAQEMVALSEVISVLNDDDALDLFKKTMASPSLLQFGSRSNDVQARALDLLRGAKGHHDSKMSFIVMALSGKGAGFEKVIKMVDDLIATLGTEQKDDDSQKAWCLKEFDSSDDTEKELVRTIDSVATQISETEDGIATLTDSLAALKKGIKDLDTSVADATEQRKEAHDNFVQTAAENNAALQLLEVAKNRLNKFYNPAVYKAPPARELTEEERLYVASGGVLTTAAPGGIANTGVQVFAQVRASQPAQAPETAAAFKKKDSSGPIALIDSLKRDLEKDIQQSENDEAVAQKDYEEFVADSAAKRASDSKTVTEKEDQKAGLEGDLVAAKDAKTAKNAELLNTRQYISELHGSCDFLLKNFDLRKEARASEVDSLKNAKAVLSGADYSLIQTSGFLVRKASM